jgi:hypothetical protein
MEQLSLHTTFLRQAVLNSLVLLFATGSLLAQNPDSLHADAAFRARDWKRTAELYGAIAKRSPNQGMAWLRLGIAHQALDNADAAIEAFDKALTLRFQVPRLVALSAQWTDPRYKDLTDRITAVRFPCRTLPAARQLDFWIGDWDVTPWLAPPASNPPLLGVNRVEPILEHCVLLESWQGGGPSPSGGKSMNFWDTNRSQWRQVWVADGGGSLDYAGSFTGGAMRFEGWTLSPNGSRVLQKLTFFPVAKDTVRQLFETSIDSGKTWQPGFDGRYVRAPRPQP